MGFPAKPEVDEVRFTKNGPVILRGPHITRLAVATEFPTVPIGSLYISAVPNGSTGHGIYVKLTETGTPTAGDWQKVTTSAAD